MSVAVGELDAHQAAGLASQPITRKSREARPPWASRVDAGCKGSSRC
jgi:hypothetical protein